MRIRVWVSLGFLGCALWCRAQSSPAVPPVQAAVYDVATIKPNDTHSGQSDIWTDGNAYRTRNVGLRAMLQDAFDIQKNLVQGLPDWAEGARFDVSAKATDLTPEQMRDLSQAARRSMLRRLLEDRFALRWHFAPETMSVFDLVQDREGAKIQHTTLEQAAAGGDGTHVGDTEIGIQNTDLQAFCKVLADILQKPVLDQTGLSGHYTFRLHYTSERAMARAGDAGLPADAPPPLFTALPEQLGLRLETGKGQVQTLVIDSIAPPTAN